MKLKIACLQIDIAFGNPAQNVKNAKKWIEKAAEQKCDLIVLPELWMTGYDLGRLDEIGDPEGNDLAGFISEKAKEHHFDIIGGSTAKETEEGHFNTMFISDRNGDIIKQYSKLHLFKLMDEHKHLVGGKSDGLFTLYDEIFAGFICYDIRFPEWIRKHAMEGAKALFVSAEWPLARAAHWKTLLTARAIENQCFVIACNRCGDDPNNKFAGQSLIIDPWGEIVAEGSQEEELVIAEIDLSLVEKVRKQIPIFEDRLPEFY
ncbi:carbon-nitrogen family hydrolase [Falsibacillus pallidus]|uniref:Putative amidohydrolase n=1 Tax=Falsibacillus pallidus TaxID=493781 RepID=A0A370GYH0_9BACI|nr:carbon-nitrogen family hydrolase [Falsibacillus pallidus]RDI47684.1 putative amidohydrolase [Falsibacillus pallidus]